MGLEEDLSDSVESGTLGKSRHLARSEDGRGGEGDLRKFCENRSEDLLKYESKWKN